MPDLRLALIVLIAVVGLCCGGSPTAPGDMDLTVALQQQSVSVSRVEEMSHSAFPFFSVNADRWAVNGEDVWTFQYPTDGSAVHDAQLVSPDGYAIGTSQAGWLASPHFYRRASMIVLYVGRTDEITRALSTVFGPRFAGGT